jgi:thiol-disulfide isomerase/thioredoxin
MSNPTGAPRALLIAAPRARNLATAALLGLAACNDKKPDDGGAIRGEGDRVVASNMPASAKPSASAATSSTSTNPKHAALCARGDADKRLELDVPDVKLDHLEVKGAAPLDTKIQTGGSSWTWVNLWAAYCGPCREEIPRIKTFGDKLTKDGVKVRVEFVSMDDDQREATKFMEKGTPPPLTQSLFMTTDHEEFLKGLGLHGDVALPLQIFIDPKGKIRCIGQGAIDDEDYGEILALMK